MPGVSARELHCGTWRIAARLCRGGALAAAALGCHEATTPVGQRGPSELEPRAGQYQVAEFAYRNTCANPEFGLSSQGAPAQSASFAFTPEAPDAGSVVLSGLLWVTSPAADTPDVVILEGPDTGWYRIAGDTLRLLFSQEVNEWVGVLRFAQYRGGQLAGISRTNCRLLSLRLERRP